MPIISTEPHIAAIAEGRDKYVARALCLVDGFPAEVKIDIDTDTPRYSSYYINVWSARDMMWAQVHSLSFDDVGHMPSRISEMGELLVKLNQVAHLLWSVANAVLTGGRERQEIVDRQLFVLKNMDLDELRAEVEAVKDSTPPLTSRTWGNGLHFGKDSEVIGEDDTRDVVARIRATDEADAVDLGEGDGHGGPF